MKLLKSFYLSQNFFIYLWGIVVLFIAGFYLSFFLSIAELAVLVFSLLFIIDLIILFRNKKGIFAYRETANRLSNGDENSIKIHIENFYQFKIKLKVIDEIPFQFQIRNNSFNTTLTPGEKKIISYNLKPFERGEYNFGAINTYAASSINFVQKRYKFLNESIVPVYPSYIQMRKYELLAISNRLTETGIKKIRKLGHSTEFEQIKNYVNGDDYRTINWKATARKNELMVNHYDEEKSQQVYNIINMGRVMKMPFKGMSLLDYAINTSLIISKIAVQKHDKAGVVTFSNKINSILPADNRSTQMMKILDLLYKQNTEFLEADYELLCATLLSKINHRSLIILYTNFETIESMKRQLDYLRRLAARHLVVIVFFENTELAGMLEKIPGKTEDIYIKTIGEKFAFEKRQIVKELLRYKIDSILTPPEKLSINSINKYLEIKARNLL